MIKKIPLPLVRRLTGLVFGIGYLAKMFGTALQRKVKVVTTEIRRTLNFRTAKKPEGANFLTLFGVELYFGTRYSNKMTSSGRMLII